MKKLIIYILLSIFISLSMGALTVSAADTPYSANEDKDFVAPLIPKPSLLPGPTKDELTGFDDESKARQILTETILPRYAVTLIGFVAITTLIFLIIAGIRLSIAYGNDEDIQKAKDQIIYALAGLVIALLSYTIVSILTNIKLEGDKTPEFKEAPTAVEEPAEPETEPAATEPATTEPAAEEAPAEPVITPPVTPFNNSGAGLVPQA